MKNIYILFNAYIIIIIHFNYEKITMCKLL